MSDTKLFSPLKIKTLEFKNRVWVSPMCQYSSHDGHPTDWHLVHLGSRAVGGAGLIIVEATAVSPEGRISPDDSGIWSDAHTVSFKRITDFVKSQGSAIGIQLAHAGRKASTFSPWKGKGAVPESEKGWKTLAPSNIAFDESYTTPQEMNARDIEKVLRDFENATERTLKAGFQVLEIHMAHGYLLHEFLSPISNQRKDDYGGSLENRMRLPLEVAKVVRKKWPTEWPLFVRISATDWAEKNQASWTLEESIVFCNRLKDLGVDLIDCSTGGTLAKAEIPVGPGYQVPFSEEIRKKCSIKTAAVGMITEAAQAEEILQEGQADAIFMAREFLREPYWPLKAAHELGVKIQKPVQYGRS
jgi:2,4-dienoyl-CoA reductase-like NADH-dependent reductase (Old Yellow Enzyme family)